MAPKFRGNSEDWLDDPKLSSGKKSHSRQKKENGKSPRAKSVNLPLEDSNAVVCEIFPNQCRVKLDGSRSSLLCSYRRAGVINKGKADYRERTPVAVGDRVKVEALTPQSGIITGVCQRKNALSRLAPGREGESFFHVLAANVDLLVVVASADLPAFSPGLVDRFLVAAELEKIPALLCVTKIDIAGARTWEMYKEIGYPVIETSTKLNLGFELLKTEILNKTVVFCGQSGVGKTSLLSALTGEDIGKIRAVNEATGKGRHTTTSAVLLEGPSESAWIDTPGVKEFGLPKVTLQDLASAFREFRNYSCEITGCTHLEEPGCAVKNLPRYSSYSRILRSLTDESNE